MEVAATEDALEVSRVCACATATRAEAARMNLDIMMVVEDELSA